MRQRNLSEAHARRFDPETSHEAARSVTKLTARRWAVLKVLEQHGPMTDEQLMIRYAELAARGDLPEQSVSGLRTRRSELVTMNKVRDTGVRSRMASGRQAIVWEALASSTD